MKVAHLICIILYFVIVVNVAHAQENQESKLNYGFHVTGTAGKMLWANESVSTPGFFISYPATSFRFSYGIGVSATYALNYKWYLPCNVDFINRKFAIATGGVVQTLNGNGQWIAIKADNIDYQINQASIAAGIGYRLFPKISIEIAPYFQLALSDQKLKISSVIDWRKADAFQQNYDFGASGNIRADIKKIYVKMGYQYGVRSIEEYGAFDANGQPLGKFSISNTLAMVSVGYRIR